LVNFVHRPGKLLGYMRALFIGCCLLIQSVLFACGGINQQVYSGKIEYTLDTLNPFNCTATITLDFDINEALKNDSIWVNWGDGNVIIMRAISVTEDTVASANMGSIKIYTHVYRASHIYDSIPAGGYYYISFQNEYRINGVNNIASGDGVNLPFYLMAQVSIDTTAGGQYKPLVFPSLNIGFANFSNYTQNGLQQISQAGDSVGYSLMIPLETIGNPVPQYQSPDQFCLTNGSASNSFTIDAVTGKVEWANPCLQGIYGYGTLLSRYRNGRLVSAIMSEQNIYVSENYVNGIKTIAGNNRVVVYPNPAGLTLTGTVSLDQSSIIDRVEIINLNGEVVANNIAVISGKFETDISHLPAGIYLIRVQGASESVALKFVKQ